MTSSPFPADLWRNPWVAGLDPRGREELAGRGKVVRARSGDAVFGAGDVADSVYLVLSGTFVLTGDRRGGDPTKVLRRSGGGEAFGEEALLGPSALRSMSARCEETGTLALLPAQALRRVTERAGGGELLARLDRLLRRRVALDLLEATGLSRALPAAGVDALLDAGQHLEVGRGELLYRQGDAAAHAFILGGGMLRLQEERRGRKRVLAYFARGDLFGDEELPSGAARSHEVACAGPAWMLALPASTFRELLRGAPDAVARLRRVTSGRVSAQERLVRGTSATEHALVDPFRLQTARSLLVIDQGSCVRCGHCTWSCAKVHDDGVSRLVRRGQKVVSPSSRESLLLPNSCQHCAHPACMADCPTGAIGRDIDGDVFIREESCVGCGHCATACPWENIQMADRAAAGVFAGLLQIARPKAAAPSDALLAVKCDLCKTLPEGPACVAACPTEAILRVRPGDVLPELSALSPAKNGRGGTPVARDKVAAWPWIAGASLAAVGLAVGLGERRLAAGVAAGMTTTLLGAYVIVKRLPLGLRLRPWFVAHVALGLLAMGAVVAHAGLRVPPNVAGALAATFWVTSLVGGWGALAYAALPRALSRLEREGTLPEDLPQKLADVDGRIFSRLTGRGRRVKLMYARILRPASRSMLGALLHAASGRTLREESERLARPIRAALAPDPMDEDVGDLARMTADRRALRAQVPIHLALRAWLPLHVILATILFVLLVIHVVTELAYR